MPKIQITETDLTGTSSASAISNTVYIPGLVTEGSTTVAPFLATSAAQLAAHQELDTSCLSYKLATHLLNYGMYIVYEGLAYGSSTVDTASWNVIQDKSLFDIRFITTGQFGGVSQSAIDCAANRGDAVALVSFNESDTNWSYDVTAEGGVRSKIDGISNGEYAAAFTPWFTTTNSELTGDSTGSTSVSIPASFGYLFAYGRSIKNNPEWYAAAGSQRGIIDELTGVLHNYTSAECEILQARSKTTEVNLDDPTDNIGKAINPIANVNPFGYIIWGNRTCINNTGTLTAQSFLNIRNAVSAIKKSLYNAARKYTFDQNNETLWLNFTSEVTPLLDEMKSGNGLLDYSFIKVKTNKKARLKANLKIIPIEAVEDFEIEIQLTDSIEIVE